MKNVILSCVLLLFVIQTVSAQNKNSRVSKKIYTTKPLNEQKAPVIDGLLDDSVFFLEERFIKHIAGEPHSLFNVFDFKAWPDKDTEEFRSFGDDEIEKLVELYSPLLSEEERENAPDKV